MWQVFCGKGLFCFTGGPCHVACRILVPRPGMEPWSPAVEAQSPNHWTTREFLHVLSVKQRPGQLSRQQRSELCPRLSTRQWKHHATISLELKKKKKKGRKNSVKQLSFNQKINKLKKKKDQSVGGGWGGGVAGGKDPIICSTQKFRMEISCFQDEKLKIMSSAQST